ncbi:hypothetical protein BGAL_0018g00190 [Botrytis galanthina]|uniref:Uncharacterized protein n=1 Tax=Botrytis galanthina TaxID=278940 RepID=A0A4S8R9R9_9HELO|nr:hypothetical protein BGAL_0018g00190 [Botrytis galanthina]
MNGDEEKSLLAFKFRVAERIDNIAVSIWMDLTPFYKEKLAGQMSQDAVDFAVAFDSVKRSLEEILLKLEFLQQRGGTVAIN